MIVILNNCEYSKGLRKSTIRSNYYSYGNLKLIMFSFVILRFLSLMRSRRESEDLSEAPISQLDEIFPSFLFNDMQDQLDENLERLDELYKRNAKDDMYSSSQIIRFLQELLIRLYNAIYRCHNQQVAKFFRTFCKKNEIVLPEARSCKWYSNGALPCLTEVGEALQQQRPFKFLFMQQIPKQLNQVLNNIYLLNSCIPNCERLLLMFPTYLDKYYELQDTLLEQSSILDQPVCYFLAICSSAEYGCVYTVKRFIKRFLEIGGNVQWLGGEFPRRIKNILPLGHLLAYCPYEIKAADIVPLLEGNQCWSKQELIQAASIMCFAHMASAFALANGLNSQDPTPIPKVDLKQLEFHINWRQNRSLLQRLKHPIQKHTSDQTGKSLSPELSSARGGSQELFDNSDDYTKQINNEMKSNEIYDHICKSFHCFLPPYKKIARRNQQTHPAIEYNEYNFKFFSYLYMKELNNDSAEKLLSLIDYCKDMTMGKMGNQQTNTTGFRKAIRYYCENLAGYTHQDFNYKTQMNDYLSKELKFFVKLLCYQPFLIRKQVTINIPHQNVQLSLLDVIHISLLVLNTKLEYSLMYLCRVLQSLKY